MCFESVGHSAAFLKDARKLASGRFGNDCIQTDSHRNPKDNPTPKLESTDTFLRERNIFIESQNALG